MPDLTKYKKVIPPLPDSIWRNPLHFIAFGLGTGTLPYAPGTFGTLIAIPFYLLLQPFSLTVYVILVSIITLSSILICQRVENDIHIHDHPGICLDEIVGYLITMINAPVGLIWVFIGFFLFRFFDILKPPPIRFIDERVKGGLGIVLDDVLAGIFSMIILQLLSRVFY